MIRPLPPRPREGFALILTLLLVVSVAALSAGMLAVAAHEARVTAAGAAAMDARARAEGAVRETLSAWSTESEQRTPEGAARSFTTATGARVTIERLDRTLYSVSARARSRPGTSGAEGTAAILVRSLQADSLAAVPAAAAIRASAHVSGGAIDGLDACGAAPPLPGIVAPELVRTGGTLDGVPPFLEGSPPGDLLDRLPLHVLADLALAGSTGTPRPVSTGGACVPGPWNWRTAEAEHPCGSPVLIHVSGNLTLRGGEGYGVLVVDGDFTATAGFRFAGLILVRGRALLDDAAVQGALRARDLELRAGSIRHEACVLRAAFRAPGFDRPLRPASRAWVPVFE